VQFETTIGRGSRRGERKMAGKSVFSFPNLSPSEISACLAEVEIEFPPQKLTAPTATEMRSVYRQLVLLLLGMRPEELEQPHFAASQVLTYPELYDEAIPEIAFARALYVAHPAFHV
jgi:kinetochore protein Nuf2